MRRRALAGFLALELVGLGCGDDAASGGGAAGGGASAGGASAGGASAGGASAGGAGTGAGGAGGAGGAAQAICPGGPYAASPIPPGAELTLVQGGFDFLEGPVWFADSATLYFSDMHFAQANPPPLNGPAATMHALTGGVVGTFAPDASSNGLAIAQDGGILACTHDTRSLSRFDRDTGARTPFVESYLGMRFNSPNDLVVRSDGNVYFSDPDWQLTGTSELPMAVYRVAPGGAVSVVDLLDKPNGVALSPDEATLYVGAVDGKVRAYAVAADGATGPATDFADVSGPDGMAVDCAGNLYVAAGPEVVVLAPDGASLGAVTGLGASATNAAFGGPARSTLFITAGGSLYSVELAIPGYPY